MALEKDLRREYYEVLNIESDFWAIKARISWLVDGDWNTTFHHTSSLNRRKKNRISGLTNSAGNWISDEREVADHIRQGFMNLYTTNVECKSANLGCS